MQILSLCHFQNHQSENASPEYHLVLFGVFGKFSKSVLDDPCIPQGILNFEWYLPKAVDDRKIAISKLRQRFQLLCYNNGLRNSWLCNIVG